MTSSSKPGTTRVRILRGGEESAPSATALAFEPVSPAMHHGRPALDEQLRVARATGYEEGYQRALSEAADDLAAERHELLRRLCGSLVEAAGAAASTRSGAVVQAEREAVELAFELAEALLQRELSPGATRAKDALVRALGLVPAGVDLVVRLHPDDVLDAEELQALVPDSVVKVVHDQAVEPGGCVVDAGPCRIDAQIGSALERARQVLGSLLGPAPATRAEEQDEQGEPA